ncbi:MAG: SDR family oxidoreductase [Bacteroidales bacterium]|nr:SDR family oxidoreductase [Bacteroidales bacterium]
MNFQIKDSAFVVGGAGSGFGKSIATMLAKEGAKVLAVSRTSSKLETLALEFPHLMECLSGDITQDNIHDQILDWMVANHASGIVFNAGGPPAGGFQHIDMKQWDEAYLSVFRWKVALAKKVLPYFQEKGYGRLLFIESVSVKQPIKNLVLSNAMRAAVVGAVKTLSQEVAHQGITANMLAPGYHSTAAMDRLFAKKSELDGVSVEEATAAFEKEIPVGAMGTPDEMATLGLWLLSPLSRYVTGQTMTHDGGLVSGIFG